MYLFVGRTYFGLKMSFFVKLLKVPLVGCHGNKNKKCSELFYSLHFKNQVLRHSIHNSYILVLFSDNLV